LFAIDRYSRDPIEKGALWITLGHILQFAGCCHLHFAKTGEECFGDTQPAMETGHPHSVDLFDDKPKVEIAEWEHRITGGDAPSDKNGAHAGCGKNRGYDACPRKI